MEKTKQDLFIYILNQLEGKATIEQMSNELKETRHNIHDLSKELVKRQLIFKETRKIPNSPKGNHRHITYKLNFGKGGERIKRILAKFK